MRSDSPNGIDLSDLGQERLDACSALTEILVQAIDAAGGILPFQQFMELALYAPELGYYVRSPDRIGAQGDFVTAPELSPAFSCCVANQVADVLLATGGIIAEFGAGTGRMARDILMALPPTAWPEQYIIIEKSPALAERQRATLEALPEELRLRVAWESELPAMSGVVLANEVFDALSVQRFIVTPDGPRPLGVRHDRQQFQWQPLPEDVALNEWFGHLSAALDHPLAVGYVSERCLGTSELLAAMTNSLERGVALIFDYGYPRHEYYHRERGDGTLLCHFEQRAHGDPFLLPGLQDITASVDFSALAESAQRLGLDVCGYTTQAWFLLACGLEAELTALREAGETAAIEAMQAAKRLVLPGEMGERIQVMALGRHYDDMPMGMRLRDQRDRLRLMALNVSEHKA